MAEPTHFKRATLPTRILLNGPVKLLVALGFSPRGGQLLTVRGRKSGEPRTTPVNPLELDDGTYMVTPRGTTHWARNLRAAGEGELRVGRRRRRFGYTEVPDSDKPRLLREYLGRWEPDTKSQFEFGKDASEETLREAAPHHPIFKLEFHD